jgi:hypothetical protein
VVYEEGIVVGGHYAEMENGNAGLFPPSCFLEEKHIIMKVIGVLGRAEGEEVRSGGRV